MNKLRILTIDDEPQVTNILSLLLSRRGFEVCQVNDPTQAIAAAQKFNPDLIFSDVDMPGIDGGELVSRLRAALTVTVPIVFLTSLVRPNEGGDGHRLMGGYPFIAKPIQLPQVLKVIREQLAQYGYTEAVLPKVA